VGPRRLRPLCSVAKHAKDSISDVADISPETLKRTRAAFLGAVLGSCVAVSGLAYIGFVFATRPLHSGLTTDFVAAIVMLLVGLFVAQFGTFLRRRWRRDYIGREAVVSWVSRNRYARVVVDGVPYWAFVRGEINRGDRVILQAAEVDGSSVRADFVAVRANAGLPIQVPK